MATVPTHVTPTFGAWTLKSLEMLLVLLVSFRYPRQEMPCEQYLKCGNNVTRNRLRNNIFHYNNEKATPDLSMFKFSRAICKDAFAFEVNVYNVL